MLRRIIAIALVVVGAVGIALAIASATVWRASDTVTASLAAPDAPFVVTEAGVLDVVADEVTIRATADPEATVTLVVARDGDVAGWVGDAPHVAVTGLSTWTSLAATTVDGEGEGADPRGSDLWVAEVSEAGEATMTWDRADGRWSLLAATDGEGPAPSLELAWPQTVSTPFLIPGVVGGAVLLLGGLALLGTSIAAQRRAEAGAPAGDHADVETKGDES